MMIAADIQRFLCASHSLVLLDLVIFNLYENPILLLLCLHLKDKETEAKRVRNWPRVTQQEARSQDVTPGTWNSKSIAMLSAYFLRNETRSWLYSGKLNVPIN